MWRARVSFSGQCKELLKHWSSVNWWVFQHLLTSPSKICHCWKSSIGSPKTVSRNCPNSQVNQINNPDLRFLNSLMFIHPICSRGAPCSQIAQSCIAWWCHLSNIGNTQAHHGARYSPGNPSAFVACSVDPMHILCYLPICRFVK
jgi:hypothetical protein